MTITYGKILSDQEIDRRIRLGEIVRITMTNREVFIDPPTAEIILPAVFGEEYEHRTAGGITGNECVVCGRQVRRRKARSHTRISQGGTAMHSVPLGDFVAEDDDMGLFPVGQEYVALFPAGYLQEADV